MKADFDVLNKAKEAADAEIGTHKKEVERLIQLLQNTEQGKRALNADILLQENKLLKSHTLTEKRMLVQC